jgi:hypothetical protein
MPFLLEAVTSKNKESEIKNMIRTILETTVINNIYNKDDVLKALQNFDNEDFNGNNGKDFTRDVALENGFESTQEYILDKLQKSDLDAEDMIEDYLQELYGDDDYYYSYDYVLTQVNNTNTYVLSVMAVIE